MIAVALIQATGLTRRANRVLISFTDCQIATVAIDRIREFCELEPEDTEMITNDKRKQIWPTDGKIEFRNVTVRYGPDLPPALENVSFVIEGGKRMGVCGRTGSGKSTLLGALFRLLSVDYGGSVTIDGEDISYMSVRQLRQAMTIIPQDPLLIESTIRENIDIEGTSTDQEIWDSLESSHIKKKIEALPEKLDTVIVGEGGTFSRGERQLLALARAVLRKKQIICLDECTSSVDYATDKAIQETLRTAFKDATVITIAHRIHTIVHYDSIVVLSQGKVIEQGPPQDLLAISDGYFKKLVGVSEEEDDIDDSLG